MADLSRHWQKNKAVIVSEAEQLRSRAWEQMREFSEMAEEDDEDAGDTTQKLIDHFRNDERLSMALIGTLAEIGLLHCMLGEIE